MELSQAIVEILREFSSEKKTMTTHPMTLKEIQQRLAQKFGDRRGLNEIHDDDYPTRKMVRRSMQSLLETETLIQEKDRTIMYSEKGTNTKTYRTGYYYKSPMRDAQLKYLIDATLYSNIMNTEQSQQLVKDIQGLSGKNLSDMTLYASVFDQSKYTQEIDVLKNVEILMNAINKQCKVQFSLNIYNTEKKLVPYIECEINPYYVIMGNGRYYLIGTYDGKDKIYFFRVDLMTQIKITDGKSVEREHIPELQGGLNFSEYILQHPYMISGKVSRMKLRVDKNVFTQIIDWFGMNVTVLPNTETENTVDVMVKACEGAMHYWLLQYGESVQALEMGEAFAKQMQTAAKNIYKKYGEL